MLIALPFAPYFFLEGCSKKKRRERQISRERERDRERKRREEKEEKKRERGRERLPNLANKHTKVNWTLSSSSGLKICSGVVL
jgi:hypothetical protein